MKKLLFLATLSMMSFGAFAGISCSVAQDVNNDGNFDNTLAEYTNFSTSREVSLTTLIKPDGTVEKGFEMEKMYEGTTSVDEISERSEAISGSLIAIVKIEPAANKLILSTGNVSNDTGVLIKSNHMAIGDLDSKNTILFNLQDNIAITCVNV